MIEIIDNSLQFAATLACCLLALAQYLCAQKQAQFLFACFYGCFSLGLLYWTLYLVLYETTPGTFYVSEIVWISSCIFLYLLQYTLASPAEREYRFCAKYDSVLLSRGAVPIMRLIYYNYTKERNEQNGRDDLPPACAGSA